MRFLSLVASQICCSLLKVAVCSSASLELQPYSDSKSLATQGINMTSNVTNIESTGFSAAKYSSLIKDKYKLDLSNDLLSITGLKELYGWLQKTVVGRILWHDGQVHHEPIFSQIEQLLAEHRTAYLDRPSPYIYAVLSQQVYRNPDKMQLPAGWKVYLTSGDVSDKTGYFGVAFQNEHTSTIVVAHRGTEPDHGLKELFTDLKQDMIGIIQQQITLHEANACTFAQKVIRNAIAFGYKVSFTGHSLGGCLAQICAYEAAKQQYETHAVVFDSPGVRDIMEKHQPRILGQKRINLNSLDITVFLSAPNLVNTCHTHLGTVYRLYPKLPDHFAWYKPAEYLLANHGIDGLVSCFDISTGFPIKYAQVIDWPRIDWQAARPNSTLFGKLTASLKDIFDGKKVEYNGFHEYAKIETQFDPAQDESLSLQDRYFLENGYHYRVQTKVNLQEIDCRHLPTNVFNFLMNYQNYGKLLLERLDQLPTVKNLQIDGDLAELLNYKIEPYSTGDFQGNELLESSAQDVFAYRRAISALLTYYNELNYIDYGNYFRLLINKPQDFALQSIMDNVKKQRESNVDLLQKLSSLQVQARLYLYGDSTEQERTEVNEQEKQIIARLDANAQLVIDIDKKLEDSNKEIAKNLESLKNELAIQKAQLEFAYLMNKALQLQRLHRYIEALQNVTKALEFIDLHNKGQKPTLFSAAFSEAMLRASLYNLQAKLYRVSLPKEEWYKVEQSYDLAIKHNPQNPTLYSSKGALLNDLGRHDEAIICHRKAEELNRYLPIVLSNLGWGIYQLAKASGKLTSDVAVEISEKYALSLKIAPYLASTWYYYALLKEDQGDIIGALEDFDKALELQPDHLKALYYRARLHYKQGNYVKSLQDLKKAKLTLRTTIPDHQELLKLVEALETKLKLLYIVN